jgi:hypothetical protein
MERLLILMLLLTTGNVLSCTVAKGETVTREQFASQLKISMEIAIFGVDFTKAETMTNATTARAKHRIEALSNAVRTSDMLPVDTELSHWLSISFVEYVNGIGYSGLAEASPARENEWAKLTNLIKLRFHNLDDSRILMWKERSSKMSQSALEFRKAFKKILKDKLSSPKIYKIDLGTSTRGYYVGAFSFSNVVGSLGIPLSATEQTLTTPDNSADQSRSVLDSSILTLALVRMVKVQMDTAMGFDEFSYKNIFSGAFDEGDPLQAMKGRAWDQVSNQAMKILNRFVTVSQDNVASIDLNGLSNAIWQINELHLFSIPQGSMESVDNKEHAYIIFSNNLESWKLFN